MILCVRLLLIEHNRFLYMERIIADSSALILLSKCSLLEIICDLFEVVVPTSVADEVASDDLVSKFPDAARIANLISKGLVKTQDPGTARSQLSLSLHRGEENGLQLALELGNVLFATDDGKAIRTAKFLNIPFVITPKIVVDLFRLGKIPFMKARQFIEKQGKIGRYSPEIIAESILSLMEVKNGKAHHNKDS